MNSWRKAYLLEHFTQTGPEAPGNGPMEPPDDEKAHSAAMEAFAEGIPELHGIRTARYTYVELATGEKELYDHTVDPYELNNIASTASPSLLASLHTQLAALQACSGNSCRTADQ